MKKQTSKKQIGFAINEEAFQVLSKKYPNHTRHNAIRELLGLPVLPRSCRLMIEDLKVNESRTFPFENTNPMSLYQKVNTYKKTTSLRFTISGSVKGYVVTRYQ